MESLFNKDAGLNTWNFIKKTPIKAFSCEDREIFRRSLLLTPSAFLWRSLLLLTGFLRMDKLTRVQLLHKLRETHLHISMTQSDFFYKFHFVKCSYELTRLVPLLCSLESPLVIPMSRMTFLSPFLNVMTMSVSTVSLPKELGTGILCL